jgi:serine/threonine protein kinase
MDYDKTQKIPFPEPFILKAFAQMVSVLVHLKSLDPIHCDITPDNIVVDSVGTIKLLGFGTAKFANTNLKKAFALRGTLAYMIREWFCDSGYAFETGIWSLGIMIYEKMIRTLPFGTKSEKELIRKVETMELPEMKTDYSTRLNNFVKSMLLKKAGLRITFEKLAQADLLSRDSTELTPPQLNHFDVKHHFGLGVPINLGEAARLFKLSAEGDSTTCMFNYCFAILNTNRRVEALA